MRRTLFHFALVLGCVLLTIVSARQALATSTGRTADDRSFESGGVGDEEIADMSLRLPRYSFRLTTAAHGSGAYLSDVQVRIVLLKTKELILEHEMQGPILLINLMPGEYEITARLPNGDAGNAEVQRRLVRIGERGRREIYLYFRTGDEVGRDGR